MADPAGTRDSRVRSQTATRQAAASVATVTVEAISNCTIGNARMARTTIANITAISATISVTGMITSGRSAITSATEKTTNARATSRRRIASISATSVTTNV